MALAVLKPSMAISTITTSLVVGIMAIPAAHVVRIGGIVGHEMSGDITTAHMAAIGNIDFSRRTKVGLVPCGSPISAGITPTP